MQEDHVDWIFMSETLTWNRVHAFCVMSVYRRNNHIATHVQVVFNTLEAGTTKLLKKLKKKKKSNNRTQNKALKRTGTQVEQNRNHFCHMWAFSFFDSMSVFPWTWQLWSAARRSLVFFFWIEQHWTRIDSCVSDTCGVENLCKSSQTFEVRLGALWQVWYQRLHCSDAQKLCLEVYYLICCTVQFMLF